NKGFSNSKVTRDFIDTISSSQIVTQGVPNNRFEVGILASSTIQKIENIWKDLYLLILPTLESNDLKDVTPTTYSLKYDKKVVSKRFPDNVRDTGWLHFTISDDGLAKYQEVIEFLIEKQLLPEIKKYRSISVLDRLVNTKVELEEDYDSILRETGFPFRRIILAKLNNNPLFEEICNYHRKAFPEYIEISKEKGYEYFKNIPIVFEKVYERLQNI
ncbi:MAG: hypothetical protein K8R44_08540, partial [Sulfurimonas sp.]|nr:hypothetical protein [Sulfurimonas sp.]